MRDCLLLLIGALPCFGATVITNSIPDSFTWDSNGSPYVLERDLYIPPGYDLYIGPGVEVLFSSVDAAASGVDTNRIEFTVRGSLSVYGTLEQSVTFRALSNETAAVWYGIDSDTCCAGTSLYIKNASIFHAVYGVRLSNFAFDYYTILDGVTLATNRVGLQCDNGSVRISRARVHANEIGLRLLGIGGWVSESLVHDNAGDGLILSKFPSATYNVSAIILNNTIYRNGGVGFRIDGAFSQYEIFNIANLIVASNQLGLVRGTPGATPVEITHSDVFGNSVSNWSNLAPGTGCISVEPRLRENGFLRSDSPCIDAGSGNYNDPLINSLITSDFLRQARTVDDPRTPNTGESYWDGLVTDLGAYEYQPPFEIISLRLHAGDAIITFSTLPRKQYLVRRTSDFAIWNDVGPALSGTGGLLSVTNVAGADLPQRFYSVQSSGTP